MRGVAARNTAEGETIMARLHELYDCLHGNWRPRDHPPMGPRQKICRTGPS
jgi:hypothetical protein